MSASAPADSSSGGIVVFSGGSAANSLVDVFSHLRELKRCSLTYVIPISDNGGSSSELIRVFGGPGIGDLRSRLVRLIPATHTPERDALRALFNHRLPAGDPAARLEWLDIVEARSPLWAHVSSEKRELIRSFLNVLNMELVKRNRPTSVFNFESASIGNMFLTGARLFLGSLESAIYLLSAVCAIPDAVSVLPALNTSFTHHISAGLADGSEIRGQNAISHPSAPHAPPPGSPTPDDNDDGGGIAAPARRTSLDHADAIEDANLPGSLPALRRPYISFAKAPAAAADTLPAPIERIWYINPYGHEIRPFANPAILRAVGAARALVYSIGSLYTSLLPSLVLRGVGAALAASPAPHKVLILNGSVDRETCSASGGAYAGADFVRALVRAARESEGVVEPRVDDALWRRYVSHVVFLEDAGAPAVDRARFAAAGIETVRVYGRGGRFDEVALRQALVAVVGGGGGAVNRRNTLQT